MSRSTPDPAADRFPEPDGIVTSGPPGEGWEVLATTWPRQPGLDGASLMPEVTAGPESQPDLGILIDVVLSPTPAEWFAAVATTARYELRGAREPEPAALTGGGALVKVGIALSLIGTLAGPVLTAGEPIVGLLVGGAGLVPGLTLVLLGLRRSRREARVGS